MAIKVTYKKRAETTNFTFSNGVGMSARGIKHAADLARVVNGASKLTSFEIHVLKELLSVAEALQRTPVAP